jgi:hypothetical protein
VSYVKDVTQLLRWSVPIVFYTDIKARLSEFLESLSCGFMGWNATESYDGYLC